MTLELQDEVPQQHQDSYAACHGANSRQEFGKSAFVLQLALGLAVKISYGLS